MDQTRERGFSGDGWFFSLKSKLVLSYLAISIIPLAAVVTLAFFQFQEALRSQASNQLVVVRDLKIKQVETYLHQIEQDIKLVAQLPEVKTATRQLQIGVRRQGLAQVGELGMPGHPDLHSSGTDSPHSVDHAKYHAFFAELAQTKGYEDVWLVSPAGDIIYSFAKRDDFATNLLRSPDPDSPPAELFMDLLANAETGQVQMTDYGAYPPAGDHPVSFVGVPVLDDGKMIAGLILQVSSEPINQLMQVHSGIWQTAETYLVGADHMARTSTLFGQEPHFFEQKVDSLAVRKGLMGESGVGIIEDYRGVPVLSAYQSLQVHQFKWVLLAEVDKSEAFGPSNRLRLLMLGIIIGTTLIVIGIGFYIGRSIAMPIIELAETSTRIASGELELRARSGTKDEIGHLAEAFNSMTGQLQSSIVSLEQRVADLDQTSLSLRGSEAKYRELIKKIQAAVVVHGADSRILISNRQAQQILGLTEDQMQGKVAIDPQWHFFREDGLIMPSEEFPVNRVLATGKPLRNLVVRVHRPVSNDDVWVLVSADPFFGPDGKIVEVIVTFADITERKQAEEALRESRQRLDNIIANSPGAIYRCANDPAWTMEFLSAAITRITGYPAADFLNNRVRSYGSIIHPEDRGRVAKVVVASLASQTQFDMDYRLVAADGSLRWVHEQGRGVFAPDGSVLCLDGVIFDISELKQAQDSAAKEQERLKFIFNALPIGISLNRTYRDGSERRMINDAHLRIAGISREEDTPEAWLRVNHPDNCDERDAFTYETDGGKVKHFMVDKRYIHSDGRIVWVAFSRQRRMLDDGGFEDLCAAVDITDRKEAEEEIRKLNRELEDRVARRTQELAESEARFRTIYETAPVSIWLEDWTEVIAAVKDLQVEGVGDFEVYFREHPEFVTRALNSVKIRDVNQWTLGMFEASDKADMLESLETVFARPDSLSGFVGELMALANGETVYKAEMRLNTVKGNRIDCLLSISFPSPGSVSGNVLVSLVDITERKEFERSLQESEERMRLFFERQLVGLAFTSPDKGWIQVNDKACQMLGYSREELVHLTWSEMTYPDDLPADVAQFERMLSGEIEGYTLEKRFVRKDGEVVFTNLAVGCVRRPDRSVDYVLAMLEDITERKQAEANIQNLNVELRHRAAELETANRELEAFCYSVSHDLRAPLRHIDGFMELLRKRINGLLDDQGTHYMETIMDAAKRMGTLIDDLLALSRMGRRTLTKTKIDLQVMAKEIVGDFEHEIRDRTLRWNIHDLPVVSADRTLMHAVLVNLISNAIKFTQPRAVGEIEIGGYEQNGESVIFLRDNGVGFDMAYVDKLFGVFQRLHKADEFEGTGVGLANVQRIISRHGGKTWAEAELDNGATFYFSLPNGIQRR